MDFGIKLLKIGLQIVIIVVVSHYGRYTDTSWACVLGREIVQVVNRIQDKYMLEK